jgi:arabinan endo-1,5-alpha-L-arabinosidase
VGPADPPLRAPAAQPGHRRTYRTPRVRDIRLGEPLLALSDEFGGTALSDRWSWVREPAAGTYAVEGGTLRFDTDPGDLFVDSNTAPVLLEAAPAAGDYVVETRVRLNVPAEGCCFNFVQAGLVDYADDDNFVKLAHVSIWETRQTEFAKELAPVPAGFPRYGNTVVGPPDEWTYLRIAACRGGAGEETYTPYTSRDGVDWVRGGAWTHALGADARVGLVSMGGAGFTANFDYVRVYRAQGCPTAATVG